MLVTNFHIRKTLQWAPIALILLVLLDIILYFIPDFLGDLRVNGYVAIGIPLLAAAFYAYVGYPLFKLDARDNILKVQSHLALAGLFGKSLAVPQMNITDLQIDESGIRRKLIITYINAQGVELSDSFSITLLSAYRLKMLRRAVDNLREEDSPRNLHLFV